MQKLFFIISLVILNYGLVVGFLLQFWVLRLFQKIAYLIYPNNSHSIDLSIINEGSIKVILWGQQTSDVFTKLELSHLIDVHRLFVGFAYLILASLIMLLILIVRKRKSEVSFSGKDLIFTALGLILLTIVLAIFFRVFFEAFHQFLFPQGNYSFAADSTLIKAYPPAFWFLELIFLQSGVVVLLVLEGLLLARFFQKSEQPHADPLDL